MGPYFEKLPPDPLTRQPFIYYPRGLPYDLKEPRPNAAPIVLLAKGTPFLWTSGGDSILMTRLTGSAEDRTDETDALMRGKLFPIPSPSD